MKILFLTRLYWPHVGGIEKHIEKLSRELQKKGHQITVITTRHDKNLLYHDTFQVNKIIRFDQPKIKYLGIIYTWYWMIRNISLFKESDVIHVHDVFIWYWPIRILLPKKRVFTTFHGQWGKCPILKVDILQKRIAAKLSTGVISIGKFIDKYYRVKSDIISYGAVEIPKTNGKKDNMFLYVGRLDANTGLPVFLRMLAEIKIRHDDINLNIVFCGDGKLREECEMYGRVLGWSDPDPYYRIAKYVFASGYLTILEAFSNNCLVFAGFEQKLQKDYYKLTPFHDLITVSDDPDELINKLKYYKNNNVKTDRLIENGYDWAKRQTWLKIAENYMSLWQKK